MMCRSSVNEPGTADAKASVTMTAAVPAGDDDAGRDADEEHIGTNHGRADFHAYFTYRPLSNLPTPPPTHKDKTPRSTLHSNSVGDGEPNGSKFRGSAVHLVNLIPSSASLTPASVADVQALLIRADLPIETVALAVCILDSLDAKFARAWRLSCPSYPGAPVPSSCRHVKRQSLPPTPLLHQHQQHQMLHIDSVPPEIIVLAALVIAVKFMEDPQQETQYYREAWGQGTWSHDQLNVTEQCIMESLDYRIMPLCDQDCLADAMVDMQLAGQQLDWGVAREPTPPESIASNENDGNFVLGHGRSKTMGACTRADGLGLGLESAVTPSGSPCAESARAATPRTEATGSSYF